MRLLFSAARKCRIESSAIIARILHRRLIHVIGDSHTLVFVGSPFFAVHYIGPATAFNLNRSGSTSRARERLFEILNRIDKERDAVMPVFGEIDCRIHIFYQHRKSNGSFSVSELIDRTVSSYGSVLEEVRALGVQLYVYGVPPAGKQENVCNYPYYAPPEVRSEISRQFNHCMRTYCEEHGYIYIDIYSRVSDERGFVRSGYAADDVHLNKKVRKIVEELIGQ